MVLDFIKLEGKHLIDNLEARDINESDSKEKDHLLKQLDPKIRLDLENVLDDYNKLQTLLSYHPILINPDLYLYYWNRIDVPLEDDVRILVLRRLTFHRMFDECLRNRHTEISTLDQIDEYVAIVLEELDKIKDSFYGIVQFIISARTMCSPNVFSMIADTVFHKTGKAVEETKLSVIDSSHSDRRCVSSSCYNLLRDICHDIIANGPAPEKVNQAVAKIASTPCLTKVPGWSRFLQPSVYLQPHLSGNGWKLPGPLCVNVVDFLFLHNKNSDLTYLYQVYKSKLMCGDHQAKQHIMTALCSRMINENDNMLYTAVKEQWHTITENVLTTAMVRLIKIDIRGKRLCQSILMSKQKGRDKRAFIDLVSAFVNLLLIDSPNSKHSHLLQILSETRDRNLAGIILRHTIKDHRSNVNFTYELLKTVATHDVDFDPKPLIELGRATLLCQTNIDSTLAEAYFSRLLASCIKTLNLSTTNIFHLDPLLDASYLSKARFHNRIREIGQFVSLLSREMRVQSIETVQLVLKKGDFMPSISPDFKDYISRCFLNEVMRFIVRNESILVSSRITTLKDIQKSLTFDSSTVKGYICNIIVKHDPRYSIELLRDHSSCKAKLNNCIMSMIMSGILKAPHLDNEDKLKLFREFREVHKSLGYKSGVSRSVLIELINLILECAKADHSLQNLSWVLPYAAQRGVPYKFRKAWRLKIQLLSGDNIPRKVKRDP